MAKGEKLKLSPFFSPSQPHPIPLSLSLSLSLPHGKAGQRGARGCARRRAVEHAGGARWRAAARAGRARAQGSRGRPGHAARAQPCAARAQACAAGVAPRRGGGGGGRLGRSEIKNLRVSGFLLVISKFYFLKSPRFGSIVWM